MNESKIIKRYFYRPSSDTKVVLGIGDDAAVFLPSSKQQIVVTTDTMVEGTHFTKHSDPFDIGAKLMAVNLSDIAAMGALPKWATLNLTLVEIDEAWLAEFSRGIFHYAEQFDVSLIGGDLCRGAQLNMSIQLIGEAPLNQTITRDTAQPEDAIYVSGEIGLAGQALQVLESNNHDHSHLSAAQRAALYHPSPRIALGQALHGIASAAIDVSDGVLHDLERICQSSQVGAEIHIEQLPIAPNVDALSALASGEDYELLFTVNKYKIEELNKAITSHDVKVTCIGEIKTKQGIQLLHHEKAVNLPTKLGFEHF